LVLVISNSAGMATPAPARGLVMVDNMVDNVDNIVASVSGTQSLASPPVKHNWRELGVHNYIKMLIIGGILCYLFRHEIKSVVHMWGSDSSWSHGYLIPFFSLYLINQCRQQILNLQTKPNYLGLLLLFCSLVLYAFDKASPSGYAYIQEVSIITTLGAIVLFLGGWCLVKYTWLPIAYLLFAIPVPHRFYVAVTMELQLLSTEVAAALLNLVRNLEATASGVIIDVVYKGQRLQPSLNVAEACSGMRLLMAFLALGVAMAYLHYRPFWQRIVLLLSTIPIAILCNIVRVAITAFIYILWEPQYAQGIYHDMLGIAMLPLAFALYGVIAWFMESLFIGETTTVTEDIVVRKCKL